jgi:hypothetical protein
MVKNENTFALHPINCIYRHFGANKICLQYINFMERQFKIRMFAKTRELKIT